MQIKIKETKNKDHYKLTINGFLMGVFERSDIRYMIEQLDNAINVGLIGEKAPELTKEEYQRMIAEAKMAALAEGDDCTMCGS